MSLDWTRSAWRAAESNPQDFLLAHSGELTRIIAGYPVLARRTAFDMIHDLHRRHGASAKRALVRMHQVNSQALLERALPESSLLRMFVRETLVGTPLLVSAPAPATREAKRERAEELLQTPVLLPLQVAFETTR